MDSLEHDRPAQNVLLRPTAGAEGQSNPSRGIALTGHHELMISLLAAALDKKGRR